LNTQQFEYDHVFESGIGQNQVYETTALPILQSVIQGIYIVFFINWLINTSGFNGTIIAYGQTASGKTHTMQGPLSDFSKNEHEMGIIPRIINDIFNYISTSPGHIEFMVKVSIVEIYMEELNDLLASKKTVGRLDSKDKKLKIRSTKSKGVYIENLTEVYVSSSSEVQRLMKLGSKNRSVGRTDMNDVSSRSHLLF
jgi:Kinesin motor domain